MSEPKTAFEIALAAKRGKIKPEDLRGAAKQLFNQMDEKQLAAYAERPQRPSTAVDRMQPRFRRLRRT